MPEGQVSVEIFSKNRSTRGYHFSYFSSIELFQCCWVPFMTFSTYLASTAHTIPVVPCGLTQTDQIALAGAPPKQLPPCHTQWVASTPPKQLWLGRAALLTSKPTSVKAGPHTQLHWRTALPTITTAAVLAQAQQTSTCSPHRKHPWNAWFWKPGRIAISYESQDTSYMRVLLQDQETADLPTICKTQIIT